MIHTDWFTTAIEQINRICISDSRINLALAVNTGFVGRADNQHRILKSQT